MRIKSIKIEADIAIKIFQKHNIQEEEVYDTLKKGNPQFRRVGGNQYVAIGLSKSRYITIFFRYGSNTKEVDITTAYPSDKKQIKSYKRAKK